MLKTTILVIILITGTTACRGGGDAPSGKAGGAEPVPGQAVARFEPGPAPEGYLPDETGSRDRKFSAALFATIPGWSEANEAYGLPAYEPYKKRYLFADAVLTMEGHGTEGAVALLAPHPALAPEPALALGKIISRNTLSLTKPRSRDKLEIRYEENSESGAGSSLALQLNGAGMVTNIAYLTWSP
jgi:hypothetical protein